MPFITLTRSDGEYVSVYPSNIAYLETTDEVLDGQEVSVVRVRFLTRELLVRESQAEIQRRTNVAERRWWRVWRWR